MNLLYNSSVVLALFIASTLFLTSACDREDAEDAGQVVERAVDKTGSAIQKGADDAGEIVKDGAEATGKAKQEMGEILERAGEKMQDNDANTARPATVPTTLPGQ